MAIESGKAKASETSLFSYDDDPNYIKALDYLSKKQQLIQEIENEIEQLTQKIEIP